MKGLGLPTWEALRMGGSQNSGLQTLVVITVVMITELLPPIFNDSSTYLLGGFELRMLFVEGFLLIRVGKVKNCSGASWPACRCLWQAAL